MITQRKGGERSFGGSYPYEYIYQFAHPTLRKLKGVIAKLDPLSEQHALLRFLHNVDHAKTLTGFVEELSNVIMDYQVRAPGVTVNYNEHPARFWYNKQHMRVQGTSTMIPRTSVVTPHTSVTTLHTYGITPHTSMMIPHTSVMKLCASTTKPHTSMMIPHTSIMTLHRSLAMLSTSVVIPRSS